MARKRTSEPDMAVSQNAAAGVRRKAAPARKMHTPATAVSEPATALTAAPEIATEVAVQQSAVVCQPAREQIAALAYSYWADRGYHGGSAEEDWLRAERELIGAVQAATA